MRQLLVGLAAALALVAGLVPAQAAFAVEPVAACAAPPCGYIVPAISLDFPEKPICRPATLGGPIDLTQCIPLPAVGSSHVENGLFRMSWDITQDGTYPADPTQPIVVTFGGTSSNPKWIDLVVEPASVEISAADLNNPQYLQFNQETQSLWFWYEVPLKVTFTREGAGDDEASEKRIERQQGAVQVFLKAKSSASGQYFKEAFGVEEFRFNPCSSDDALTAAIRQCAGMPGVSSGSKESPGVGVIASGLGLLGLVVALRRRP